MTERAYPGAGRELDRLTTVIRRYAALKARWDECQVELEDWYERTRECPDHGDPVLRAYAAIVRVVRTQSAALLALDAEAGEG